MALLKKALAAGPIWSLGAMSGTSLDGVDAAMVKTDGARIFAFGPSAYRRYSTEERTVIRAAFGSWPGEVSDVAAEVVEQAHVELLSRFEGAALVGFHGQTLAHEPKGRGTHQAGDGQVLAEALGLPVVWDFRASDVNFGGEGAPLAPFFHFACARWVGIEAPVAFLNLGGVGNLTWVDPGMLEPETVGACLAFDTGPANAPVNDLVAARLGADFDENGALAEAGRIDDKVLARFLAQPYFRRMPPKSLDRNEFAWLLEAVDDLPDADAAATLTAAAAASVAEGIGFCPEPPASVLVTGGGRMNPQLMRMLGDMLPMPVMPVEDVGLDGDMLEAQAFAYLAVRVAQGWPTTAPGTTGVPAPVGGARLSEPSA